MKTKWIICYDISDDKTRRSVFKMLNNHAQAIQYSVFAAEINKRQQSELRFKLAEQLGTGDSIRWYPICKNCIPNADEQGTAQSASQTGYFIV